jgi:hypothetical protein
MSAGATVRCKCGDYVIAAMAVLAAVLFFEMLHAFAVMCAFNLHVRNPSCKICTHTACVYIYVPAVENTYDVCQLSAAALLPKHMTLESHLPG